MDKLKIGYLSLVKGSWINEKLEQRRTASIEAIQKSMMSKSSTAAC